MISIVILVVSVVLSIYCFGNQDKMHSWMLNPYQVTHRKQYYRILTSGFIHADWMHLLFNMLTFYFFGPKVEYYFNQIFGNNGGIVFVIFYLAAIIISDIPTLIKHKNNPGYNSLGASGAVSAIVFASILFDPLTELCIYFVICLPGFILAILYLIFSYYQAKKQNDFINHTAHLTGAIFGVVFCLVLYPEVFNIFIRELSSWNGFNFLR
jgi:membrane associated rhomboid family serine protease